jgi:hypothetical protein
LRCELVAYFPYILPSIVTDGLWTAGAIQTPLMRTLHTEEFFPGVASAMGQGLVVEFHPGIMGEGGITGRGYWNGVSV